MVSIAWHGTRVFVDLGIMSGVGGIVFTWLTKDTPVGSLFLVYIILLFELARYEWSAC
jgi:hypothetical protein